MNRQHFNPNGGVEKQNKQCSGTSSPPNQYDSLRRNYRPLPSCREILSIAPNTASRHSQQVNALSNKYPQDEASNIVNRFITNPSATPNQFHEQQKPGKQNKTVASPAKRSPKRPAVVHEKHAGLASSPASSKQNCGLRSKSDKNQQQSFSGGATVINNYSPATHNFNSPRNDSPAPFRSSNLLADELNNKTFPTEANFLLAEETALLTTTTTNSTARNTPLPLGFDEDRFFTTSNRQQQWQLTSPSAVDINQLSQLQQKTPNLSALPKLNILSRTPTPTPTSSASSRFTNNTPVLIANNNEAFLSDITYSTSEYEEEDDDDEKEDGGDETDEQQQHEHNNLLIDNYYHSQQQNFSSAPDNDFDSNDNFAPNISVLAQQHERRITQHQQQQLQSNSHNSSQTNENFNEILQAELAPYEASYQQLLHAFEQSRILHNNSSNQVQQHIARHTFVKMNGQTHMVELPQPQSLGGEVHQLQPARTGERSHQDKVTTTTFGPRGSSTLPTSNNNVNNTQELIGPSFENISQSMLNIESSLNRLNEAAAVVVVANSTNNTTRFNNQGRVIPLGNGTSQSWTQQEHHQHSTAGKFAHQQQPRALITKMWSSLCLDPLFPVSTTIKPGGNLPTATAASANVVATTAAPPTIVADPWEIPIDAIKNLEWRGAGSQGAVFVGDLMSQRVAVKKVCTRREVEEIRPFRRLHHVNIIRLLGVCTQELCYSIVMEYCQFGSLYDYIQQHNRIMPVQLLGWTKQIAAGMHYLHTNKIIHRDLKSPNVLLSDNQTVKISDFGTSKFATSSSNTAEDGVKPVSTPPAVETSAAAAVANNNNKTWSFVGTVSWMAPEVIRSEAQNEKVDTWAFGVIVWEMLFGLPPYPGVEDASAIMWGVGSEILTLPIPDNVPQGLRLLMLQCWSSKPRNRPTFRNIQIHLDIAAPDVLEMQPHSSGNGGEEEHANEGNHTVNAYSERQDRWREQILTMLHKEVDSALKHSPRVLKAQELAILEQRKKELRHAQDIRMHYERKLERANNLYLEMTTCMLQLEQRERELVKREQRLFAFLNKDGRTKLAKRRILKAMLGNSPSASTSGQQPAALGPLSTNLSSYRWAASAHTTPMHQENDSNVNITSTNNHMSISLDRGITQSTTTMAAVVGTTNGAASTMPFLCNPSMGTSANHEPNGNKKINSNNKTIVERTIVKSKHRLVNNVQSHISSVVIASNIETAYSSESNIAPPEALFDDRPFRRSKRAIRGSNSSSASSNHAASLAQHGTHVRRRRRIYNASTNTSSAVNVAAAASSSSAVSEISPDLFKGLPRRTAALKLAQHAASNNTRFVADVGIQCRLLGTPLTLTALAAESSTLRIVSQSASNFLSSSSFACEQINDNSRVGLQKTSTVGVQGSSRLANSATVISEEAVDSDPYDEHEQTQLSHAKHGQITKAKVDRASFEPNADNGVEDNNSEDASADENDIDCVVPNVDEDEDDHDLSDREHEVSVMRQRLSSGKMHLSLQSSSSSSSSTGESESEVASDATVSLSGPSVSADNGTLKAQTAHKVESGIGAPRSVASDVKSLSVGGQTSTAVGEAKDAILSQSVGKNAQRQNLKPVKPFSDDRLSGMFSSDAARSVTKLRSSANKFTT